METCAEWLLVAAQALRDEEGIVAAPPWMKDRELAVIRTALELERRPALAFQAQVEGWTLEEIVRRIW